jgi:outer membrane protein assembly factor BamA
MKHRVAVLVLACLIPILLQAEPTVTRIDFAGNRVFPDRDLAKVVQTKVGEPYDALEAKQGSAELSSFYAGHGYYFAEIDFPAVEIPDPQTAHVTYYIREHRERRVDSLQIVGSRYFSERRLCELLGVDGPMNLDGLASVMHDAVDLYTSRGFLFAETELDSLCADSTGMTAVIRVNEGPLCRAGSFRFNGDKVTRPATLLRIARAETGVPLTLPMLVKMEDRIAQKAYIRSCEIRPLDASTVLIDVQEGRMTRLAGLFGYDNQANQRKLTGYLDLDFLNLFGTDRALGLYWQRLTANRTSVKLDYHESGPFNFPLAGDVSLSREEVDSTYIRSKAGFDIYYETMFQKFGVSVGVDDIYPGRRRPIIYPTDLRRQAGLLYELDTVDFWANPSRGSQLSVRWTEVFRSDEDGTGHESVTEADAAHFRPMGGRWTLMTALHGKSRPRRELADYDLFELGGANSLRGFPENQFQGCRIGWSNLELRYLTARTSRLLVFVDNGYVELVEAGRLKRVSNLVGYGFGLAVQTRAGVFLLNYALSCDQGVWRRPLDGVVHFGFETQL